MVSSIVELWNLALISIGAEIVEDPNDTASTPTRCRVLWPTVRDAVLRAHPWNCALKRDGGLAALAAPSFGFSYAYQLPTDCLRVWSLNDDPLCFDAAQRFRVEGRSLLTNETVAQIAYVWRLEDVSLYDALLVDALAARLAAELAYAVTASGPVRQQAWQLYGAKLREARGVSAQEGGTPPAQDDGSWIGSRL